MDDLLNSLFGAQPDEEPEVRRRRAQDFVNRVEHGNPREDVSTEEAVANYKTVAGNLNDDEYVDAARDALSRFSPEERREFGRLLSQNSNVQIQGDIDDPNEIASLTNQLRSGSGGLSGLLGGGGSDDIMNMIGGLIGGTGANTPRNSAAASQQAGGIGDLLGNPIVKAILAAIAAAAMRKYAGGGGSGGGLLDGIFGGGDEPKRATAPSSGGGGAGVGGLLDDLMGGNRQDRPQQTNTGGGFRPKDSSRREDADNDNDGGGGFLDALFGTGGDKQADDRDERDSRDRGDILKRRDKPQNL